MPPVKTPMTSDDKLQVLESLTLLYDAVTQAETARRRIGHIEEADTIGHWADSLMEQIGELRSSILDDWMGAASKLVDQVEALTSKINDMIDDLKNDVQMADKMLAIAGYVDQAISIAAKLLK
jgi:hypothetical protein